MGPGPSPGNAERQAVSVLGLRFAAACVADAPS